jgi:hypothetical protein
MITPARRKMESAETQAEHKRRPGKIVRSTLRISMIVSELYFTLAKYALPEA